MAYSISAHSVAGQNAAIQVKQSTFEFGITPEHNDLASPAELFLSSFSACVLKNVERFSGFMKFTYAKAEITVTAIRLEKPPRMDEITYELLIYSNDDHLNINLLKKNIEKFGTIYNTVKLSCSIIGTITQVPA